MGYRVSWIARRGTSTQELLDLSGRTVTGERHEFPDVGWYLLEPPTAASPWVVLIADGSDNFGDLQPAQAQALSTEGNDTLFFWCSDTVMATELIGFKNGSLAWSVRYHCADQSGPKLAGAVPAVAHEILARLRSEQEADEEGGADYVYDLTAELGRALTGFRHDTDLPRDDPEPFQLLSQRQKPSQQAGPAWWQFWKR
jgi:hypothetical protein